MAGGPLAREVMCMVCLDEAKVTRATRIHEGVESDQYRCDVGHEFGMDWSRGPASEAQWPPPPEIVEAMKR